MLSCGKIPDLLSRHAPRDRYSPRVPRRTGSGEGFHADKNARPEAPRRPPSAKNAERVGHPDNLRREQPRIPFVNTILSSNCHSESASVGQESAVLSASKKQIPRFARNDKGEARNDKQVGSELDKSRFGSSTV
jgi:hypothetical protein